MLALSKPIVKKKKDKKLYIVFVNIKHVCMYEWLVWIGTCECKNIVLLAMKQMDIYSIELLVSVSVAVIIS